MLPHRRAAIMTVLNPSTPYYQKVKALFGANLIGYWPLDEGSGTTVYDISGGGHNGSNAGATVAQPGIGDGKTSYLYGADADDKVDVFSAGLAGVFSGAEGGISVFCKPAAGLLTDSTFRRVVEFIADAQNKVIITRSNTSGQIYAQYLAGNTSEYLYVYGLNTTRWMHFVVTWNKAADRVTLSFNGKQYRTPAATLGVWAGAITGAGIGFTPGGTSCWRGNIAHVVLTNREITATETATLSNVGTLKTYSVIGDSISANANNWIEATVGSYPGGVRSCLINHAVSAHSIMANMDAQVAAAANDNADVIIAALGSNDGDGGDMVALQAKVATNLAALKLSNPRATIYYLNVLPKWTAVDGLTPVDKSHIRAAIAAACTAQGVTCWDTFTTPWITAADTSDGTHPTAAGHAKIAAEVLARL